MMIGMIDASMKCIAWNGRLLVIGFAAGSIEKVAMNRVLLKNCSIVGLHWGAYKLKEPEVEPALWDDIFSFINSGKIKPIIFTDKNFEGLESLPSALIALGGRETWGKVAVTLKDHEGEEGRSKL